MPLPASPKGAYRGRFAPSPSGPLHWGSLYTALASFLEARSRKGVWLLRIDDVDTPRVVPGAADAILHTLERLGLEWDGSPVYQSKHFPLYAKALETLERDSLVYACSCTRKTVTKNSAGLDHRTLYPGTCREAQRSRLAPHSLRLKTSGVISFSDRLRGWIEQDLEREVGDFVLRRRDGVYAYHLACVVDDFHSGITDVLRGVDLIDSTPRQIFLQRLLGFPTPSYAHIPLVIDRQGVKLSKQSGAQAVDDRAPSKNLTTALGMLGLQIPQSLRSASPKELLSWAIDNWDLPDLRARNAPFTVD